MNAADFVSSGLSRISPILPRRTVVFSSSLSAYGVTNGNNHYDNKDLGGYEPQDNWTLTFTTSDFGTVNPQTLIGSKVTIDTQSWRIVRVRKGECATHIEFVSPNRK